MIIDIGALKLQFYSVWNRVFGGRIARTTFAFRVILLSIIIAALAMPIGTILVPSSKAVQDIYLTLACAVLAWCALGFIRAYVKRLHDIGLQGYWAIAGLFAAPAIILYAANAYTEFRAQKDYTADLSAFIDVALVAALALPLLLGLWKGQTSENRFGPVPEPVEHLASSKFNVIAGASAAALLVPTTIYAGIFQDGIWIGRGNTAPAMPTIAGNAEGFRFMTCWNVKGVGAGSGSGPLSGIYRDGYEGSIFEFIVTPDGQVDIVTAGNAVGDTYLAEGFKIVPYGIEISQDGTVYGMMRKVDQFMLAAIFDQGGSLAAINYTTFAFSRNKNVWPEFHLIMTSGMSLPEATTELGSFPTARGRLMIGDCMSGM